jgi:YebC/PmpR family DNA-binding regulatory protein
MSGHSKWHNIKLKKGKVDAQRGALFTKLSKEIILAAKNGSPDPDANYRLKMAVEKARVNNVPLDNIKRAIARASGAGEREIEEIRYEGYGPAGVAVIVDAATDNRNRTASELRFLFSRNNGTLGETGSVGWMFASRGIVEVDPGRLSEDELTEKALVDGVIDVRYPSTSSGQAGVEVVTEPQSLMAVKDALEAQGVHVRSAELAMEATQTAHSSGGEAEQVLTFLDALEEHEDVQRVYSNADFDDAQLEALA